MNKQLETFGFKAQDKINHINLEPSFAAAPEDLQCSCAVSDKL
jgi:hypothetical protein